MAKPTSVDAYFEGLEPRPRAFLDDLRRTIRAAAPEATESIAYDMPAFRLDGRFLVSYAAFKAHCSLFPASDAVVEACGDRIKPFVAGKGTLRFTLEDPIPLDLVTEIVHVRLRELASGKRA
jgi:uncharacterized protein YdhG (YjbR/CyaY superfamily)